MITIGDDTLNGVEEAIDVDDGTRVANLCLEIAKSTFTVVVGGTHGVDSEATTETNKQSIKMLIRKEDNSLIFSLLVYNDEFAALTYE